MLLATHLGGALVNAGVHVPHALAYPIAGVLFGAGWGLLVYHPGTALGALGEGRWDALFGIFGLIASATIYAEAYPWMTKSVLTRCISERQRSSRASG